MDKDLIIEEQEDDIELDEFMMGFAEEEETEEMEEAFEEARKEVEEEQGEENPKEKKIEKEETALLYKLKHLGAEREYQIDDILPLAQKGLDYDRVKGQLANAANTREKQIITRLAEKVGMPYERYLEDVEQGFNRAELSELVEQGMSETVASELLEMRRERKSMAGESEKSRKQQDVIDSLKPLLKEYPDLREIPPEVAQMIKEDGVSPLFAYRYYMRQQDDTKNTAEREDLKNQLAAMKAGKTNTQTTPRSARSKGASEKLDPFTDGFMRG